MGSPQGVQGLLSAGASAVVLDGQGLSPWDCACQFASKYPEQQNRVTIKNILAEKLEKSVTVLKPDDEEVDALQQTNATEQITIFSCFQMPNLCQSFSNFLFKFKTN